MGSIIMYYFKMKSRYLFFSTFIVVIAIHYLLLKSFESEHKIDVLKEPVKNIPILLNHVILKNNKVKEKVIEKKVKPQKTVKKISKMKSKKKFKTMKDKRIIKEKTKQISKIKKIQQRKS